MLLIQGGVHDKHAVSCGILVRTRHLFRGLRRSRNTQDVLDESVQTCKQEVQHSCTRHVAVVLVYVLYFKIRAAAYYEKVQMGLN